MHTIFRFNKKVDIPETNGVMISGKTKDRKMHRFHHQTSLSLSCVISKLLACQNSKIFTAVRIFLRNSLFCLIVAPTYYIEVHNSTQTRASCISPQIVDGIYNKMNLADNSITIKNFTIYCLYYTWNVHDSICKNVLSCQHTFYPSFFLVWGRFM